MIKIPNWAEGYIVASGKLKDLKKFCKYFLFDREEDFKKELSKETKSKKYFARSFTWDTWKGFKNAHLKGKNDEVKEIQFGIDFAWSCWSCIFDGYPNGEECITLKEALKGLDIELAITTEEGGMGFEEKITYGKGKRLRYSSKDMPTWTCECGNKQMICSDFPVDEETCYECGKEGLWKK